MVVLVLHSAVIITHNKVPTVTVFCKACALLYVHHINGS